MSSYNNPCWKINLWNFQKHAYSILIEKEKLADTVAIKEEPLQKIEVLEKVVFVMKSVKVYKNLTTKK